MRVHGQTSGSALALVGALGSVLLLVVVGCTGGSPSAAPSEPAPSSTKATPTVDPRESAAIEAAIAAYNGYFTAYAAAAAAADPDDPNLARYVGGALLSLSRHNLRTLKEHGAVELGHPKTMVMSSHVELAASPPTVTIEACVDYSDYRLVYKANQSPVPNSSLKLPRYTTTATVNLFVDGRWLVAGDTPHRETPC